MNLAKRRWQSLTSAGMAISDFHDQQERLIDKAIKAENGAAFLGRVVPNQWNVY